MVGVIVNTLAVIVGSSIGLLAKKGIPTNWSDLIFKGLGLCVIYIGISGSLKGENPLIVIISIVIGAILGQALDLDRRLNNAGQFIESKFKKKGKNSTIAEGFVSASLLFCVGALTIVGSLQAGLTGDNEMLFTKSGLDFISAIIFSATLGIGVLFSAVFVLVFQGGIVLLAQFVAPYFSDAVINEMTCVGSLLIIALGLNILGITKLKVMNYLPAIFFPIGLVPLMNIIIGAF